MVLQILIEYGKLHPYHYPPIVKIYLTLRHELQMTTKNEWGGRSLCTIAEQFGSDVFSWFTQSKEMLYIDDLEYILDEAICFLPIE